MLRRPVGKCNEYLWEVPAEVYKNADDFVLYFLGRF